MDYAKLIDRAVKLKTQKLAWAQQCARIRCQMLTCDQQLVKIRSQKLTTEQQTENLRTLRLRNDLLQAQVDYNRKMTNAFSRQFDKVNENEEYNIARMRQLMQLQNRGFEAVFNRAAPEVRDLFPEPTDNNIVFDVIRQLTDAGYINNSDGEIV